MDFNERCQSRIEELEIDTPECGAASIGSFNKQEKMKYEKIFGTIGTNLEVFPLSQVGDGGLFPVRSVSKQAMEKEIIFFGWLFGDNGPYCGMFSFSRETLIQMVQIKYGLYADQGKTLEIFGGILLQTEGPGVWRERTEMLRCKGSKAIPTIYPWIRKDEGYK